MKNNIQNMDVLIVNIQQTVNLLTCFEDFCDFEGNFDDCQTEKDFQTKATAFSERLKYYDSLIFASKALLGDALRELIENDFPT